MNGGWICQDCLTLEEGEALELHIQAHAREVPWSYDEVSQATRDLRAFADHCTACRMYVVADINGDVPVVPTVTFSNHASQPARDVNLPDGTVKHVTLNLPRGQGKRALMADPEALAKAFTAFGAAWQGAIDYLNTAFKPLASEAQRQAQALRDAGLLPDEGPTDPKARALWAAKNRNTGPAQPSAGKARRPRRNK